MSDALTDTDSPTRGQAPAGADDPSSHSPGSPAAGRPLSVRDVAIGFLIAAGIILFAQSVIAGIDIAAGGGEVDSSSTPALLASQFFVVVAFGGVAVGYSVLRSATGRMTEALRQLGLLRISAVAIGIGALGWLIYLLASIPLAALLDPQQEDVTRGLGVEDGAPLELIIAGLLIIPGAAIAEELFFRGFVFRGLRGSLPLWAAAVISGVVFGSLHLVSGDWAVALQLSLFGAVLAVAYERTGSLWTPITAHAINNSIAFVVLVDGMI